MANIFVFTASAPPAQRNIRRSIAAPFVLDSIRETVPEADLPVLQALEDEQGGLYAWGAQPGPGNSKTWNVLKPGDHILAYWSSPVLVDT